VYYPYLLINKTGLYWTKPENYDKMDSKGIEVGYHPTIMCIRTDEMLQTVRRDNCRLVSTVIETCFYKLLVDRDVKGAEEYVMGETPVQP
jgi:DNA polymerase delta subunit 1